MSTEIKVPVLGESITEATLGEWLKKPGDAVAADEPVASLETDKVSVEVPSPVAGVMGQHAVEVGATVEVGAMLATIEAGDGAPAKTPAVEPAVTASPAAFSGSRTVHSPDPHGATAMSPSRISVKLYEPLAVSVRFGIGRASSSASTP